MSSEYVGMCLLKFLHLCLWCSYNYKLESFFRESEGFFYFLCKTGVFFQSSGSLLLKTLFVLCTFRCENQVKTLLGFLKLHPCFTKLCLCNPELCLWYSCKNGLIFNFNNFKLFLKM